METVTKVVLPSAGPGILTGIMLSVGRAVGETHVIFTMGSSLRLPTSLMDSGRTMAVHFYTRPRRHINGEGLCYCPGTCLSILFINIIAYYIMNELPQNTRKDMDIKIRTEELRLSFGKRKSSKGYC